MAARDPLRSIKIGGVVAVLVVGWVFVLWSNKFHVTAPVVFACLGFLAVTMTVVNLWRTGAAAAAPDAQDDAWGKPMGARGELEKEKRTLLKAIKEAEFDQAMGKLSDADAQSLIRQYRARAIDVIKALDQDGAVLTPREQIAREVKARVELAAQAKPSKRAEKVRQQKAGAAMTVETAAEEKEDAEDVTADSTLANASARDSDSAASAHVATATVADASAADTDGTPRATAAGDQR